LRLKKKKGLGLSKDAKVVHWRSRKKQRRMRLLEWRKSWRKEGDEAFE
jgi:hypothetical protein